MNCCYRKGVQKQHLVPFSEGPAHDSAVGTKVSGHSRQNGCPSGVAFKKGSLYYLFRVLYLHFCSELCNTHFPLLTPPIT